MLYEARTRSKLFKDKFEYENKILKDSQVEIPHDPRLERIINKCLRRKPEERPGFREIYKELESYIIEEYGAITSIDILDKAIEQIIRLSTGDGRASEAETKRALRKAGIHSLYADRIHNYAMIIAKARESLQTTRHLDVKERLYALSRSSVKIIELADSELKKGLASIYCLDLMRRSMTIVNRISRYPAELSNLRDYIERLEICLSEAIDIASYLITRLALKTKNTQ